MNIPVKWDYTCPCCKQPTDIPEDRPNCELQCQNCQAHLVCQHDLSTGHHWLAPNPQMVN